MMIFLIIGLALLFYVAIPAVGAFFVRYQWRKFRKNVCDATQWPIVSYELLHERRNRTGPVLCRLYGSLEAVQGDERIWIRGRGVSVGVELTDVPIYVLPAAGALGSDLPDSTPRVYRWGELAALPEGTNFFVAGAVDWSDGSPVFRPVEGRRPTVIVFDCPEEQVYSRAIWTGRQRNEFWNPITAPALAGGFLAELTLALLANTRSAALIGIVLALAPILPFFPPGNLGFFFYRRLWRKARKMRGERDLVRLLDVYDYSPRWPEIDAAPLPDGGYYYHCRVQCHVAERAPYPIVGECQPGRNGESSGLIHLFTRGNSGSRDPMPIRIGVGDDPVKLARRLQRGAQRRELLSGICFSAGIAVNAFLAAVLLGNFAM